MADEIEALAFSVEGLRRDAEEIAGWGAGNEAAQVRWAADEIEKLRRSLRTVQNAAKTIAAAHGTELEHLRQNATYDHKLRAQVESLMERDAIMTEEVERLRSQPTYRQGVEDAAGIAREYEAELQRRAESCADERSNARRYYCAAANACRILSGRFRRALLDKEG